MFLACEQAQMLHRMHCHMGILHRYSLFTWHKLKSHGAPLLLQNEAGHRIGIWYDCMIMIQIATLSYTSDVTSPKCKACILKISHLNKAPGFIMSEQSEMNL